MDQLVRREPTPTVAFEINPKLNMDKLRKEFHERGRVRVRHFLNPMAADAVYHYLDREAPWRTFLVAHEKLMGTPANGVPNTPEEDREILDLAYAGARTGFAYVHDATRPFPEDLEDGMDAGEHAPGTPLSACDEFLASEPFLAFVRKIVGLDAIKRVATQATRFRGGHFVSFHSATSSADKTMKRRATFFLNLTPEWRAERGGLLEFREPNGDVMESYMPVFNTLDLIAFPQGWWVSTVAPFAESAAYSVRGRVYVD